MASYTIAATASIGTTTYNAGRLGLDPGFDMDGKAVPDLSAGNDAIYATVLQEDGKMLAAGKYNGSDFLLARFHSNGKLDTSFGTGGWVSTDFSGGVDTAYALAIQTDGKIVLAGGSATVNGYSRFALARYLPDGRLDNTFNANGKVTTDLGCCGANREASAYSLVLQPDDGKIVAVGSVGYVGVDSSFAAARYNTNGALDNTFDSDGKAFVSFPCVTSVARAAVLQAGNKIVLAGNTCSCSSGGGSSQYDFALARLNSNGSLDTTFGNSGRVVTDVKTTGCCGYGPYESAYSLILQPTDGKIIAAGTGGSGDGGDFVMVRYSGDGIIDNNGFGSSGKVITNFNNGSDIAYAATLTSDNKIILAGSAVGASGTSNDFALAKYNTDGSLDSTFGVNGKITTAFITGSDAGRAVMILKDLPNAPADGRIVAAGYAGGTLALARYQIANQVTVRDMAPPSTPVSVTATLFSTSRIDVNWDDQRVSGVTYEVYRSTDPELIDDPGNLISTTADTRFIDDTVVSSTRYFYLVKAVGPGGVAEEMISQMTGFGVQPTDYTAEAVDEDTIELSWEDNSADELGYTVKQQQPDGSWSVIGELPADSTYLVVSHLSDSTTFTFSVQANFASGQGTGTTASATTKAVGQMHGLVVLICGHFQTQRHPSPGLTYLEQQLRGLGYRVRMGWEWVLGPPVTVNADGGGSLYDWTVDELNAGTALDVAVVGYSHGAALARRFVDRLGQYWSNLGTFPAWQVRYVAYIDAVKREIWMDNWPLTSPEDRLPDNIPVEWTNPPPWNDRPIFFDNYYETNSGWPLPHGTFISDFTWNTDCTEQGWGHRRINYDDVDHPDWPQQRTYILNPILVVIWQRVRN